MGRPKGSKNKKPFPKAKKVARRGRSPALATKIATSAGVSRPDDSALVSALLNLPAARRRRVLQALELIGA